MLVFSQPASYIPINLQVPWGDSWIYPASLGVRTGHAWLGEIEALPRRVIERFYSSATFAAAAERHAEGGDRATLPKRPVEPIELL